MEGRAVRAGSDELILPASGRAVRRRARRRRSLGVAAGLVLAALLGATAGAEPSGVAGVDRFLSALFAATLAYAGRRARRWSLFVPAGIGASLTSSALGLGLGVGGIVVATADGWRRRPSSRLGVLASALAAGSLLRMGDLGFHGASALLTVAAAAPVLVSGWLHSRQRERRAAVALGIALAGLATVATIGGAIAGLAARNDLDRGRDAFDAGLAAARDGDTATATTELREAAAAFDAADRSLAAWWALPARGVPLVGHNLRASSTAASLAHDVTTVGAEAVARAGSDELRVTDGRVPLEAIGALRDPVAATLEAVLAAEDRAATAASGWLVGPVASAFEELTAELADARPDLEVAIDAVDRLPSLLGGDGPRRYLVLFVTPVEARAGGFPGNFAEVVATDGDLEMPRFGRISELTDALAGIDAALDAPADYDALFGGYAVEQELRNITVTPDFPTTADLARQLYPQAGGQPIDGVLSVDPAAIAALLRLTGPIQVAGLGRPVDADNAEQLLLRDQYVEFPDVGDRVDLLETLGRATFDRLTTGDLPRPTDIADVLAPAGGAGHLRIAAFDADDQAFLERIGITGSLRSGDGDFLAVVNTNRIGGKLDLFLERGLTYDVEWDARTGELRAVLEIRLRNGSPSSGLPFYVIGNALLAGGTDIPLGTNRSVVSVYTPWLLDGEATLDGVAVFPESRQYQGLIVHEVFVELAAGEEATIRLPLAGALNGPYRLEARPQLLAEPEDLLLSIDASEPASSSQLDGGPTAFEGEITLDGPETIEIHQRSHG